MWTTSKHSCIQQILDQIDAIESGELKNFLMPQEELINLLLDRVSQKLLEESEKLLDDFSQLSENSKTLLREQQDNRSTAP